MTKFKTFRIKKILLFTFLIVIFASLSIIHHLSSIIYHLGVNAQEMNSQNFKIQGGNLNITSGSKASTNYKLTDVVGQTAANLFASKGYLINAGFLNAAAAAPFQFSVSPTVVDFGILSPNTPVERNIDIFISNGNVPGYTISAAENQPLTTSAGGEIPDTLCDSTATPCTQKTASRWVQNTTYGFGYRMAGLTVPTDFAKEGVFRPFPATRRKEPLIMVMQSKAQKVKDKGIMTVRVNTGQNQPVGQYRNVISFTALAGI